MGSEPAASNRAGGAAAASKRTPSSEPGRKAQITAELRAMMRDVPISDRLLQVLDQIDAAAAEGDAGRAEAAPPPRAPGAAD